MNFLTIFLDSVIGFIRRNPIFCITVAVVAIVCPPLLGVMMWGVAALILISVISAALLLWRLRRVQRTMEEQFRRQQNGYGDESAGEEGEVKVHRTTDAPQKKISDDVGEYVDFEEEKTDNQ